MHTVILGNGIIGMSIAFRLAKRISPSDRISIVGRKRRQGSATLAAAGMLNSFAEIESGSLNSEIERYRFELSRSATRMWPEFEKEIFQASGSGETALGFGTYVVNNTAADDLDDENFDAIVEAMTEFDEPFEFVAPRDIPNYLPQQKYRANRAILIRNEGWVNPRVVLDALDELLGAHPQVALIDSEVIRLVKSSEGIDAAVLDDDRRAEGDKFVLATGATVTDILSRSRLAIAVQRVFYGVGVSVEIRSPDFPHTNCVRTPNRGLACGLYSVPYLSQPASQGENIVIGASNFISPVPCGYGRLTSVEYLMRGAIEQINTNFYRAEMVRVNVGWRPTSLDTFPLLGKTSISNLLIASGTKRDGFHLAPVISEKLVAMLFEEPVDARFDWFAPERQPIRSLSREAAIEKAVRHQLSAAYQHGFTPSTNRMPEQVRAMHRKDVEQVHDKAGADDWGIPPEMLDMYRYGHANG